MEAMFLGLIVKEILSQKLGVVALNEYGNCL